ncbi:MAG TPA: DUF2314 domain-containing protein [Candidatus Limnocylindria bacterium]|jgi:uncharacterized protein YegJ (DUF2314 family)|nr:DUF2314 domain-containing protein [Candidatus Limnocylindria bacterium]
MSPFWKPPGGSKTFPAALTLVWGAAQIYIGYKFLSHGLPAGGGAAIALGVLLFASGIGLWSNRTWARWPAIAVFSVLLLMQGFTMVGHKLTLSSLINLGSLIYLIGAIFVYFSPHRREGPESDPQAKPEDSPLVSLVLLLRKPRYLDARILASYLESAWGGKYTVVDGKSAPEASNSPDGLPRLVVARPPSLVVTAPTGVFAVHNFDRPYGDNRGHDTTELRTAQALAEHRAWMSVDLIKGFPPFDTPESAYPSIAKLIAALSGPDCIAIYRPETNQFNLWDESLEEQLRSPTPLAIFSTPTFAPVLSVETGDAKMAAAVATARTRWPEFANAYTRRDGSDFMVKAPVTVNNKTEFIWIEVETLGEENITGKLANDPIDLGNLKLGSTVTVRLADLNDWMFVRNGEPVGLFTAAAFSDSTGGKPS